MSLCLIPHKHIGLISLSHPHSSTFFFLRVGFEVWKTLYVAYFLLPQICSLFCLFPFPKYKSHFKVQLSCQMPQDSAIVPVSYKSLGNTYSYPILSCSPLVFPDDLPIRSAQKPCTLILLFTPLGIIGDKIY